MAPLEVTGLRRSDPASVGWFVPGTEARLVDGELLVRGPQVMATPSGWLRTGDLVSIRDDGQLVIEGRLKELVPTT